MTSARKADRVPTNPARRVVLLCVSVATMDLASKLDREADHELACGHHTRAEQLAWRAAEIRGQA